MELNDFAAKMIQHLSRMANSLEAIEAAVKGGKVGSAPAADGAGKTEAPAETAAAKKKRLAAEEAAAKAATAPKADRPAVNKALVELKDTVSKEAAQAVYQKYGYTAMSKIEEKDFDAILADAEAALADAQAGGQEAEDDDL